MTPEDLEHLRFGVWLSVFWRAGEPPFEDVRDLHSECFGLVLGYRDFRLSPPDQPRSDDGGFFFTQPVHVAAPEPSLTRPKTVQCVLPRRAAQFPRFEFFLFGYVL